MKLSEVATLLRSGKAVEFRPSGHSMEPLVRHRELVRLRPVDGPVERGDVVLAKVNGHLYLHLVGAVRGDQVRIENKRGHVNGWTSLANVFGVLDKTDP